jgi:glycosyltransferase involved in cell wall biosynthesis
MDRSPRSLRVGLVTPGWPRERFANGIVSSIETLLPALEQAGLEISVLSMSGEPQVCDPRIHFLREPLPPAGFARLGQGLSWKLAPGRTRAAYGAECIVGALSQLAREKALDLIELEESFGWAAPLSERCGLPLVVFLHGPWFLHGGMVSEPSSREFRERVRAEGQGIRAAAGILAPSRDVLARTARYYRDGFAAAQVIPYGLAARPSGECWQVSASVPDEILFVGRFDVHKGGDVLLDAFARVRAARPRSRLVFAGPDRGLRDRAGHPWSLRAYAEQVVPGAIESGHLRLLGQVPAGELDGLRRRALVTVSCSRYENLSLAVLEAMALGCPLVVADRGGLPEHVRDGESGRVVKAGNSESLARTLLELLDDPRRAERLGRSAREHIARHLDPAAVALRRAEFYRQVAAAHRVRHRARASAQLPGFRRQNA